MRIALTGGGSGGHITPLIAILESLKQKAPDAKIVYFGAGTELEKKILKDYSLEQYKILGGKWRRYFSIQNFIDVLIKIPLGVIQSLVRLLFFMPDVIFSKGGYAPIPLLIAAWIYHIPVIIHESDTIPGVSNRFAARFADTIAIGFPPAKEKFPAKYQDKIVFTGNPVRASIFQGSTEETLKKFNISSNESVVLVFGGSQGAKKINDAIIPLLPTITQDFHVVHLAGEKNLPDIKAQLKSFEGSINPDRYHLFGFLGEDLKHIFPVTSLVISRAGASAIAEISAIGIPSIIIPIHESANDHQKANAYFYEKSGGCIIIEEPNLTRNIIVNSMERVFADYENWKKMSAGARTYYVPEAADSLADLIITYG